jgi:DNA-directed RNA polymerase subunit alpha
MRIKWRGLELPSQVIRDKEVSTDSFARFIVEPFERGFGTTVGNSLRRILLSSLEGAAVSAVKIAGASHEFCTLPGVKEDVTDIILNIKGLIVKMDSEEPKKMRLSFKGKGQVTAADLVTDPAIEVINDEHLIATLTDNVNFDVEMTVRTGRGYAMADENEGPEQELGVIPIDSIFSPVIRVRYRTEETRVGQLTNYDRLILEVWTRGTISPEYALVEAAKILRKHLNPFVHLFDVGTGTVSGRRHVPRESTVEPQIDDELQRKLNMSIDDLDLSVRAKNCLESVRILTVGALVAKTEAELLRVRSFGKTSLREVHRKLDELGLKLGLNIGEPVAAFSGGGESDFEVENE